MNRLPTPALQSARARPPSRHAFRYVPLIAALATIGLGGWAPRQGLAQVLPQGLSVARGQAGVTTSGSQMTITNNDRAILNWQSFSIAAGHSVRFDQPDASSQVLNRVVGTRPSEIFGRLSSNGGVWLLNSNGVLFGRDARVDVANLVASTLQIGDADWQARRYRLYGGAAQVAAGPSVRNQGELRSVTGGRIWLLGGAGGVVNDGRIETPRGQVGLAAGHSIDLVDSMLPNIAVRVSVPAGEVVNGGHIVASDGRIDLQAALVGQRGVLQADGTPGQRGGGVQLTASRTIDIAAGSRISADGAGGGHVGVDAGPGDGSAAGGTALIAGDLSARGDTAAGGTIRLLGAQVGLLGAARVDASGRAGGGEVLVGGGLQGRDPGMRNARAVYLGGDASISADAIERGDGGRIVLWSNETTRVYGSLSATGGSLSGDGGLIETSGSWLDARPKHVAAQGSRGRSGTWLLDPHNITIRPDVTSGDPILGGTFQGPDLLFNSTTADATIPTSALASALSDGINVTISTGPLSAGAPTTDGNIFFTNATLSLSSLPQPTRLTLSAASNVVFSNSTIKVGGSEPLDIFVSAGRDIGGLIGLAGSTISTPLGTVSLVAGTPSRSGLFAIVARLPNPDSTIATPSNITARSVQILADTMSFGTGATVTGLQATGTAITLAGTTGNIRSFTAPDASAALATSPTGRWLIYAADPATPSFSLGAALNDRLDFTQHAAVFGTPSGAPAGLGNGLMTALTPTLTLTPLAGPPVKVYDGTTTLATLAGGAAAFTVGGLLSGERMADATAPLRVAYADANVGSAIPLTWAPAVGSYGSTVVDARGRPVYGYGVDPGAGAITRATLTYTADRASMFIGSPVPSLTGTVDGFVGAESQRSATSGTLAFETAASPRSPAGRYAILGGGLSARNYRFVQAPGNADALRVSERAPAAPRTLPVPDVAPRTELPRTPWRQLADLAHVLPTGSDLSGLFGPVDTAQLSPSQTLDLLEARDEVSRFNQGPAMRDAQLNPQRALVPACDTVGGAIAGVCMITEALKAEYLRACPVSRLQCASGAVRSAQALALPLTLAAADRAGAPWEVSIGDVVDATHGLPAWLQLAQAGPAAPAVGPAPTRWVLSIGIGEYENKSMHGVVPVKRFFEADKDADYVARALGLQLGYSRIPVRRPHKAEIISAFNDLAARAREQDSVVIYYAGYGQVEPSRRECYWSTAESTADSAQKWISNLTLGDYLRRISARQVIMLVDSCFSDPAPPDDEVMAGQAKPAPDAATRRAAVAVVSGTNAPLVDVQRGAHSAFAEDIVGRTQALKAPLAGREFYVEVGELLRRLLTQLPEVDTQRARKYIAVYRASRRGGHEPGADYFFRPRPGLADRPD